MIDDNWGKLDNVVVQHHNLVIIMEEGGKIKKTSKIDELTHRNKHLDNVTDLLSWQLNFSHAASRTTPPTHFTVFFTYRKKKKVWEKGSPQEDHHLTWAHQVILNKSEAKWSIFFLHWDPSCLLRCCRGSQSRDDNMMMGCGLFGRLGRGSSLHFSLSYYFKSLGIGPHKRLTRRVELNQSVGLAGREQRKRGDPEKRCPFCHTS